MNSQKSAFLVKSSLVASMALIATLLAGCAGGDLTTREKGAGIGALGGAAMGGLIGSAVHHPAAGAAIGTAFGLGAGALVGDQLQGRENAAYDQQNQINANQQEIQRQQRELQNLRSSPEYQFRAGCRCYQWGQRPHWYSTLCAPGLKLPVVPKVLARVPVSLYTHSR